MSATIKVLIQGNPAAMAGPTWIAVALSKLLHTNGIDSGIAASGIVPTIDTLPSGKIPLVAGTRVEIQLL